MQWLKTAAFDRTIYLDYIQTCTYSMYIYLDLCTVAAEVASGEIIIRKTLL